MTKITPLKACEAFNQDRMATQISVNLILNVLRDYIPRSCIHEAEDKLFEAFFVNGTELTSNNMRKEYEAWKQIDLHVPETMIWPK